MTVNYAAHVSRKTTPQGEPIPGQEARQVANNAGGYVYTGDSLLAFRRFLILGSEGGSYYVSERKLTREAAKATEICLRRDPLGSVKEIMDVSRGGRAPSNTPAIFALALGASLDAPEVRAASLAALSSVCRIPTHLFQFVGFCEELRGWGRGLRRAVARWYLDLPCDKLAYEVVKYQQREGWSNRDLLRLSHPKTTDPQRHDIFKWVTKGEPCGMAVIEGYERAKHADVKDLPNLVTQHGLTREMLPTEALNSVAVWDALMETMPLTAMIRNLGKMSAIGLLKPLSRSSAQVVGRLGNAEYLRTSRVHPLSLLTAQKIYAQGKGDKGSLTWEPVGTIIEALNTAFYAAFDHVEPTGKRLLLALDVSGSMGSPLAGSPLSCREAAAVLAMVTARVEKEWAIVGFTAKGSGHNWGRGGTALTPLAITPGQRLDDITRYTASLAFGGTDCSLPWGWLLERNLAADAVITLTDNETWAGDRHVTQAIRKYRDSTGSAAKSIVVGMTATDFTINDPLDPLGLDVVGFDTRTPSVMAEFIKG
jgi:60 kDa SS-A/Ro ribonucleoprotein